MNAAWIMVRDPLRDQFWKADTNPRSVGASGSLEGFIPIWGSGRTAINAFQNGRYGSGVLNGGLMVLDLFFVGRLLYAGKAGLTGLGAGGLRAGGMLGADAAATDLAPRVFSIGMHPVQARNIPYLSRTPGLGDAIHLEELLRIRGIPGAQGVELASGSITLQVFRQIWALSDFHGIEYGLVKVLRTDGKEVWRLYSGSSGSVGYTIKPGERILRFGGHTHPSGNPIPSFPQWSELYQRMIGDVETLNQLWQRMGYSGRLPHSRVIYGPNRFDTTRYFPDLGR